MVVHQHLDSNEEPGMKTKPIGCENPTFLIDKLGSDCTPTQQLREYIENALQAIEAVQEKSPDYEGRIVIDFDPYWSEKFDAPKLSITDNGEGMTADALAHFFNNLAASGRRQALDANFGVGAKVSSLPLNPFGVVYESWRGRDANMIWMWKDVDAGTYGLKPLQAGGEEQLVLGINDAARPEIVHEHGTKVVLLGEDSDENTCEAPDEETAKTEWLIKTINRRYARFPSNVTILARTQPAKGDDSTPRRRVRGQLYMLNTCAAKKGTVRLRGATAHWFLLPPDDDAWLRQRDEDGKGNSKAGWGRSYDVTGHVAVLVSRELYAHRFDTRGRFTLQEFGITAGSQCVVIYVEPDTIGVNMSRTLPQFEGGEPPWTEWSTQFRERMPPDLAEFVRSLHEKAHSSSDEQVRKALAEVIHLFDPPRFAVKKGGSVLADPDHPAVGHRSARPGQKRKKRRPKASDRTGTLNLFTPKDLDLSDRLKPKEGVEAERVKPRLIPNHEWLYLAKGTRQSGELEDVAAEYVPSTNLIRINGDFRLFTQIADTVARDFPNRPGAKEVIRKHLERWFAQALTEAVLGVQSLVDGRSETWGYDALTEYLSPQALTIAVCPRVLPINQIKSAASKTLGRTASDEAGVN